MPRFIFAYHGGKTPDTAEEREAVMEAWRSWMTSLGDALVVAGNPAGPSQTVAQAGISEGGGSNPLSGYSVVVAVDSAAACEMATGCPMVVSGHGTVEVAELMEM